LLKRSVISEKTFEVIWQLAGDITIVGDDQVSNLQVIEVTKGSNLVLREYAVRAGSSGRTSLFVS